MVGNDKTRIKYLITCLFNRNGFYHAEWLKKHNCFHSIGDKCFFQPFDLPQDAELISFGDNVVVASNVHFIAHDVIHHVLNTESGGGYKTYYDLIIIKDNVFIGSDTTVLAGVTIGSNSIVAAGSLVNKDVPDGSVVAGVPAKVIETYDELKEKRAEYSQLVEGLSKQQIAGILWDDKKHATKMEAL